MSKILIFLTFVLSTSYCFPTCIRRTRYGKVRGKVTTRVPQVEVEEYLGVPYASPPTGHLRYKRPQKPMEWNPRILDTTTLPSACPQEQRSQINFHRPGFINFNEDCLYMNIYVPRINKRALPILLFIHGGSNIVGMGAVFDGDILAAHGEIIVITFNYRLGNLGFFADPSKGIKGNNGLNGSRLFRNSIIHSGAPISHWFLSKCITTSRVSNIPQTCRPGYSLITTEKQQINWVVIDGEFLKGSPEKLYTCGKFHPGPVLLMMARDEGHPLDISTFREPNLDQALGFYGPNLFAEKPDFADNVKKEIKIWERLNLSSYPPALQVRADLGIFAPMMKLADMMSKWQKNVYTLSFDYVSQNVPGPDWIGVQHGWDIFYVFGVPTVGHPKFSYTPRDAERPQKPLRWSPRILDTTNLPPACPQEQRAQINFHRPGFDNFNEDCLYMNIYVPRINKRALPILLYIHGGSNSQGMGAVFDGDILAAHGEMIVITFNYRLANLGFFADPSKGIKGNNGLMDQVLVMKWIQRNIKYFNGNPSKVTLYGHSAGAGDVGVHLLSDLTKGLFRNTIMHSGTPISNWFPSFCVQSSRVSSIPQNCRPGYSLITTEPQLDNWVIIDGEFLKGSPEKLFTCGKFRRGPVLLMISRDEGFPLDPSMYREINLDQLLGYFGRTLFAGKPDFAGIQHGWDVFYVFGVPTVGHPKFSYTARDAEVSKRTMQLMSNFVKKGTSQCFPTCIRKTLYGKVRGKITIRVPQVEVEEYLGVPYASPPTGYLRYKRPKKPIKWNPRILETTNLPPACPQFELDSVQFHKPGFNNFNEDCLYMNIYVPRVNKRALPIMLFIHGGSNRKGMGAMFDGDILAAHGEIIVITFNFRLDNLGFYADPSKGVKGNNGLMDQVLAMKWIQRNIKYFNGDPSKVTIYGHSAGAGDAGLHLLSSLTKGLFRNAIIHSGAPISHWFLSPCIQTSRESKTPENCRPGTSLITTEQQKALQVRADVGVFVPMMKTADMISTWQKNVYTLSFDYVSQNVPGPEWIGVQHGWDIFYVFGVPTVGHPKFSYTARDAEVSKMTMQLISNFVKEGNWRSCDLKLRKYNAEKKSINKLDYVNGKTVVTNEINFNQPRLDFWYKYLFPFNFKCPYSYKAYKGYK
ncbi:NLGN [Mytilus edulis]|uniref:NLGN n=1 Tax=Mytilus edulis TaxID=6550 RepID=A0A8S3RBM9_MYTED|nr:NLGN [Mytilus edulis]